MVRSKSQMNSLGEKSGLKKNRTALGGRWGKKEGSFRNQSLAMIITSQMA